ncbi:MAG: DUF2334 domain-containing protein [Deltaproteobacteria bacterium]|nr:DUF2334 domain-containing protein [Deltaproteobacteria bacterium]
MRVMKCLGCVLVVLLMAAPAMAATAIYYDADDDDYGLLSANLTYNLAAHFETEIDVIDIASYSSGDLDDYDYAMYIGIIWENVPQAFMADIVGADTKVLWIGGNLPFFTDYLGGSGSYGFQGGDYNDSDSDQDQITYKSRDMERAGGDLSFFEVTVTGSPTIYSTITSSSDGDSYPHFLCSGNLCYLAEQPQLFEGSDDRMLVFADLLHEFYGTDVTTNQQALIRFYEVAPGYNDIDNMKDLLADLDGWDVPLNFAVVPVFKDPQGWLGEPTDGVTLDDDPALVALLKQQVAKGATITQLGYTHQLDYDDGATGDTEFVLNGDGVPLPYDTANWAKGRVEAGLAELNKHGLTPDFWETPWHMASQGDYSVFADYFDYFMDQPMVFPYPIDGAPVFGQPGVEDWYTQKVPYGTWTSTAGMGIAPGNAGCIFPGQDDYDVENAIRNAERFSIIRDAVISFCIYSNLPEEELGDLVEGVEGEGYTFVKPEQTLPGFVGDDDDDDDTGDDDTGDDDTGDDDDDDTGDDDTSDDDDDDDTGDDDTSDDDDSVDDDSTDDDSGDDDDDDSGDDDSGDDDTSTPGDDDDDDDSGACGC